MASSEEADARLFEIVEAIEALARFEFGTTAPVGVNGDLYDALAAGVNMLGEELSGFRREVDEVRGAVTARVPKRVGQDQASLGVGVVHLHGEPRRRLDDVGRPDRGTAEHVFARRHHTRDPEWESKLGDRP